MVNNKSIIAKAVEQYKANIIIPTMEKHLRKWCWEILDAAIKARQRNPQAHNFTGNLLNSIVVPEAIMPKMKKRLRKRVFFKRDYDGEESAYLPTVETNGGWGRDDAQEFFETYKPKGNNLFDIVVAYTVEYANWIQMERGTAGILNTYAYAERTGKTFLKLK